MEKSVTWCLDLNLPSTAQDNSRRITVIQNSSFFFFFFELETLSHQIISTKFAHGTGHKTVNRRTPPEMTSNKTPTTLPTAPPHPTPKPPSYARPRFVPAAHEHSLPPQPPDCGTTCHRSHDLFTRLHVVHDEDPSCFQTDFSQLSPCLSFYIPRHIHLPVGL